MNKPTHLSLISLLGALLLVAGLFYYLYIINLIVEQTRIRGVSDIRQILEELNDNDIFSPDTGFDVRAIQGSAEKQAMRIPAHIIIVDSEFNLLADSRKTFSEISGTYFNAEILEANRTGIAGSTLRHPGITASTIIVARSEYLDGRSLIIYVAYDVDGLTGLFTASLVSVLISISLSVLLIILVVLYIQRRYRRPIRKLIQHTSDVVAEGYGKISVDTGNPEISQLVGNFNNLVDRYTGLIRSDNRKYSRINTLLSNLNTGILMVDTGNEITLVNPMAEELLDLNKVNLFKIRSHQNHGAILGEILKITDKVNSEQKSDFVCLTTGKGLILDISVNSITGKYRPYEPIGALAIIRDVTEIKRMERLKDEFVANVSHELRTPLTVIGGFVETLKSWKTLSDDDRVTALNIIDLETERLKKLISELLHLSRIDGDMGGRRSVSFDAAAIVRDVVSALKPLAERQGVTTGISIPAGQVFITGFPGWYRQIVYNLYDNAVKYTLPGGWIRIGLRTTTDSSCLEIEDSGIGIAPDHMDRIFERFYRVEGDGNTKVPGSGLGLTITRQIVEEFNGSIEATSMEGRGTTFRVKIPGSQS